MLTSLKNIPIKLNLIFDGKKGRKIPKKGEENDVLTIRNHKRQYLYRPKNHRVVAGIKSILMSPVQA